MILVKPYVMAESKVTSQPQGCDLCRFPPEWVLYIQEDFEKLERIALYGCGLHVNDLLYQVKLSVDELNRTNGPTGTVNPLFSNP